MRHSRWVWMIGLMSLVVLAVGCGRPSLPGQHFSSEKPETSSSPPIESPLPEQPYLEWGDPEAKVRVLAFFPIDDDHAQVIDLLKGLVEKYPGKVYARYVDFRTPEGNAIFQRAEATGRCVLINGESEVEIESETGPYTVTFAQEIGRYWTADDLKAAIAQEVARE